MTHKLVETKKLEQWLEALQKSSPLDGSKYEAELEQKHRDAISAIKEALKQEPLGTVEVIKDYQRLLYYYHPIKRLPETTLDIYTTPPQPKEPEPAATAFDVMIEDKALKMLDYMVSPSVDDKCNPVRLIAGKSDLGYGLYIWSDDYPEEGAVLLAELPPLYTAPQRKPPTPEQMQAQKGEVFAASIKFLGTLTGMTPPPIESAPPEVFEPFRDFTEKVCSIFSNTASQHTFLTDEPHIFWNNDDPEQLYENIDEFLNEEWVKKGLAVGETRTVQRAIRLPNVVVRVTSINEDGDLDYVVESAQRIKDTL